jgi:hypothetical protein
VHESVCQPAGQQLPPPELDELPPELDVLPPEPEELPPELDVLPPELDEVDASMFCPIVTKLSLHPAAVDTTTPTAASAEVESETNVRVMARGSLS